MPRAAPTRILHLLRAKRRKGRTERGIPTFGGGLAAGARTESSANDEILLCARERDIEQAPMLFPLAFLHSRERLPR